MPSPVSLKVAKSLETPTLLPRNTKTHRPHTGQVWLKENRALGGVRALAERLGEAEVGPQPLGLTTELSSLENLEKELELSLAQLSSYIWTCRTASRPRTPITPALEASPALHTMAPRPLAIMMMFSPKDGSYKK